ncbi:hypothetical protein M3Y95_00700200 [Aphelenchoides besseyi]|nr:hypothetical protein M3Y95_00700200 [Aphelenchoides besseyi]
MAEFPELGVHCSLKTCNKLDFFPFLCKLCKTFYCADHRFEHSCQPDEHQLLRVEKSSSGQLKKFLCSMSGCFNTEYSKIECSQCQRHFCMTHRQCEDHECEALKREAKSAEKPKVEIAPAPLVKVPKKHKDPAQQAMADKVAVMRLKSRNPCKIPPDEVIIVFVNLENEDRLPCMLCKKWTVNRCRTSIVEQCKLTNTTNLILYNTVGESNELQPLDIEIMANTCLTTMQDVYLLPQRE